MRYSLAISEAGSKQQGEEELREGPRGTTDPILDCPELLAFMGRAVLSRLMSRVTSGPGKEGGREKRLIERGERQWRR